MLGFLSLAALIVIVIVVFKVAKKFNLALPAFLLSVQFWKIVGIALGAILLLILLGYGANYVWDHRGAITPYASAVLALLVLIVAGVLWIFKKIGAVGAWALGALAVLVLLFGVRAPEVLMKVQGIATDVILDGKPVFVTTEKVVVPPGKTNRRHGQAVAEWPYTNPDGTIPRGQWSNVVTVGLGCRLDFSHSEGRVAEYQYYSREWRVYNAGTSPNASHIRFMVTKEGVTELPYTTICS